MMKLDREELLRRFIEGQVLDEEARQLESLLEKDPAFLKQASELFEIETFLRAMSNVGNVRESVIRSLQAIDRGKEGQTSISRAVGRRVQRDARSRAPVRRRPVRWGTWISIAACLAIIVGALVYNEWQTTQFAEVLVAHIKATAPDVKIIRRGQTVFAVLNMPVYAGDRIVTGSGRKATFIYEGEKTEIRIDQNTVLNVGSVEQGKRLRLEKGVIDASVDPQPKDKPMIVTTRQAEAKVKGTTFRLGAKPDSTRIDVLEGLVRLTRLSDRAQVDVAGGQYAVAAEGVELVALAILVNPAPKPAPKAGTPVALPKPATHLYGKVLFEDDFDQGIAKWTVVSFGVNPDPNFPDILSDVEDGAERLWAMNRDYRRGNKRGPGVSCVMINPNVDDMVKQDKTFETVMAGLQSKKAITAERFVVEIRYYLDRTRKGGTEIGTSGITLEKTIDARQNPKASKIGTGWQLIRSEFRPAKGHPGNVLDRRFFCGPRGDRYFGSSLVKISAKQVVLGVCNGTIAVDHVTVREILDDPNGEEGGQWDE